MEKTNSFHAHPLTTSSAWRSFQKLCNESSPHTARAYLADVKLFAHYCRLNPEAALFELLCNGPEEARARVSAWMKTIIRTHSNNTVSRRASALKSFVAHAGADGLVDWKLNVLSTQRQIALSGEEPKSATAQRDLSGASPEDFKAMLAELESVASRPPSDVRNHEDERLTAIRDIAMIGLMENPMLRPSEVCGLNIRDIRSGPVALLTLEETGRSGPVTLPLVQRVASFVDRWLQLRVGMPDEALFTRFRRPGFGPNRGHLVITSERITASGLYRVCVDRGTGVFGDGSKRMNPHSLRSTGNKKLGCLHAEGKVTLQQAMTVARYKKPEAFLRHVEKGAFASRAVLDSMEAM